MSRVPAGCLLVKVLKDFDYLDAGAVLVMPECIARPLIQGGIVAEVDAPAANEGAPVSAGGSIPTGR